MFSRRSADGTDRRDALRSLQSGDVIRLVDADSNVSNITLSATPTATSTAGFDTSVSGALVDADVVGIVHGEVVTATGPDVTPPPVTQGHLVPAMLDADTNSKRANWRSRIGVDSGGEGTDATARAAAGENRGSITALQSLTRDLRSPDTRTWVTAAGDNASGIALANSLNAPAGHVYANPLPQPPGNDPDTNWPAANYILVRVPHGADLSDYRLQWFNSEVAGGHGNHAYSPGNHWVEIPLEDSTWDYYATEIPGGGIQLPDALGSDIARFVVQHHDANPTIFDGDLAGGIVKTADLTADLAARLLPTGGGDGKFVGHASGSPAWVDAPGGGGDEAVTLIGAQATSANNVINFNAATRSAFVAAWNAGTYRKFLLAIDYTVGTAQLEFRRLPSHAAIPVNGTAVINLASWATAHSGTDVVTDLCIHVVPSGDGAELEVSCSAPSFFVIALNARLYGVS